MVEPVDVLCSPTSLTLDLNANHLQHQRMDRQTTHDNVLPSFSVVSRAEDLSRIEDHHLNLCIWRRVVPSLLAPALVRAAVEQPFSLIREDWLSRIRLVDLMQQVKGLTPEQVSEWTTDIERLLQLFCEIVGCQRILLKLATTARTDCPVFHTDFVPMRMLCTYAGPGTEFIENQDVLRGSLGNNAGCSAQNANHRILRPNAQTLSVQPFDVALCKGEMWPGNRGRGLVHRSPSLQPGSMPRIKLTVDSIIE